MNQNPLQQLLPVIMPKAIAWAEESANTIDATGVALVEKGIATARRVGVQQPERIRLVFVSQMPWPQDPILRQAGEVTGLFGPNITGLTLGYGIFLVQNRVTPALLAHEFRHVQQYEAAGSIAAFLPRYLQEILTHGYWEAPLEVDARNHEHLAAALT